METAIFGYIVGTLLTMLGVKLVLKDHVIEPKRWIDAKYKKPSEVCDGVSIDVIVKTKGGYWYQAWYDFNQQEWINAGRGACKYIQHVEYWIDPTDID